MLRKSVTCETTVFPVKSVLERGWALFAWRTHERKLSVEEERRRCDALFTQVPFLASVTPNHSNFS